MVRSPVLRRALLGGLLLLVTLSGMLVQRQWALKDRNASGPAEAPQNRLALMDSLMNLPSTGDSMLLREAESGPVRLVGPTLVAWDDPGDARDARPGILLHPPVVEALRKVAEEEGFTLAVRSTRQLRIETDGGIYSASHAAGDRNESFVVAAPGSQSELHWGVMSLEELRDVLRRFRRTYRS